MSSLARFVSACHLRSSECRSWRPRPAIPLAVLMVVMQTLVPLAATAPQTAHADDTPCVVSSPADDGSIGTLRTIVGLGVCPEITFDTAQMGAATITLTSGPIQIGTGDSSNLQTVAIDGGSGVTIQGDDVDSIFTVTTGGILTLNNLTISGSGDSAICNNGTLNVEGSVLSGNSGLNGGGAIFNDGSLGAVATLTDTAITSNAAPMGGAIYNYGDGGTVTLTIANSTLSGNSTFGGSGGAISDVGGPGGAIYNDGGAGAVTVAIANSTLSGNSANSGGGIYNDGDGGTVSVTIANSTLSGNSALVVRRHRIPIVGAGDGLYNTADGGDASLAVHSSILADGATNECAGDSSITDDGYDLALGTTDGNGCALDSGDEDVSTDDPSFSGGEPTNGELADNGGATQTIALGPGSIAIGNGDCQAYTDSTSEDVYAAVTTDQRGAGYPRKDPCDIGAFEAAGDAVTATDTPTATGTATLTDTYTPSDTATLTEPPSDTPTDTATDTATTIDTSTPSDTATDTATVTEPASDTPTAADTSTNTYTPSDTPTGTATATDTSTPSDTPADTATVTELPSDTSTASNTPAPTNTASDTPTVIGTAGYTPAATDTPSNTATDTYTASATPSNTPTVTNTQTDTPTSTYSPTAMPTDTHPPADTSTGTDTASVTAVATGTASSTPVPTDTATDTPADTSTASDTPTPTDTASGTPSATHAPTSTVTGTPTDTATSTPTATATSTRTEMAVDPPVNLPTSAPYVLSSPTATGAAVTSSTATPADTGSALPQFTSTAMPTATGSSASADAATAVPPVPTPAGHASALATNGTMPATFQGGPAMAAVLSGSTQIALRVASDAVARGQTLTLNASLESYGGSLTGSVTFKEGKLVLGTASVHDGVAFLTVTMQAVGPHHIVAVYDGPHGLVVSTTPLSITVGRAPSALSVWNQKHTVVGGRKNACQALMSAGIPSQSGCEAVFSTWLPGARVTDTLSYADGTRQTYTGTADGTGHLQHAFVVKYEPSLHARHGEPATRAWISVVATSKDGTETKSACLRFAVLPKF